MKALRDDAPDLYQTARDAGVSKEVAQQLDYEDKFTSTVPGVTGGASVPQVLQSPAGQLLQTPEAQSVARVAEQALIHGEALQSLERLAQTDPLAKVYLDGVNKVRQTRGY